MWVCNKKMSTMNMFNVVIPPLSPMLSLPSSSQTSETQADARNRKVLAATFALDFSSFETNDPLKLYQSMRGFLCAYLVFPLLALSSSACDAVFTAGGAASPDDDLDVADVLKPRLALINDTVFRIYYAVQSAREPLATLTRLVCLLLNKPYPGEERDVQANADPTRDACLQHLLEYFQFHPDVVRLARDLRWLRASFLSNFPNAATHHRDITLQAVLHSFAPALFGPYAYNRVVVAQTISLEGYLLAIVVPVLAHSRAAADPNNTVLDTSYEPPIAFLDIDAIAGKIMSLDQDVMTKQNRIDLACFLSHGSPAYYDPSLENNTPIKTHIARLPAPLYNHVLQPVVAAILEHFVASFVHPILVHNHNRARALAAANDAHADTESDSDSDSYPYPPPPPLRAH